MPTPLPQVTMVIVDCVSYGGAINAIQKSLQQITPARTIFFTDIDVIVPGVDVIKIDRIKNKEDYSRWIIKELGKQEITTSHILICQADGYVIDGAQWDDEFLKYDLIGAPWLYIDGRNVGNGGMTLRSTRLHQILALDTFIGAYHPEDDAVCRLYRNYLECKHDIKFAPEDLAHRFSFELHEPKGPTFGFHGNFHKPYVEPIVIRRSAALGDIIQVEPVLQHFHNLGHPIYLDCPVGVYQLLGQHYFPVKHYDQLDKIIPHRVIDLDHAYEVQPKQLHLKSYFEIAGIKEYKLRNPQLAYPAQPLFNEKYVVLHIDERETTHRNVYGVEWNIIADFIKSKGYLLIQIGKGWHQKVGYEFNCVNEVMMKWLIAHCLLFLGVDSGPSHIAVATQRKCVLFFGSVKPEYIHADLSNIEVIQSPCPIQNDFCWHNEPGTRGIDCVVDADTPPCCKTSTTRVIDAIEKML